MAAINSQAGKIFSENIAAELLLSEEIWKQLDANAIDIDLDPAAVVNKLNLAGMVNKILQTVMYISVYTAIFVAIPIPVVNIVLAYLAGSIAQELVTDDDKDKPRKQKQRQKNANQLPKTLTKQDFIVDLYKPISDAMVNVQKEYHTLVNNTVTTAIDMVMLRRFDETDTTEIYAVVGKTDGIGLALYNRMLKASAYTVIYI